MACTCANGMSGSQLCRADNTFEPCACSGNGDAGVGLDRGPNADLGASLDLGFDPPDLGFGPPDLGFGPPDLGVGPTDLGFGPTDFGFLDLGGRDAGTPDLGFPGNPDATTADLGVGADAAPVDGGQTSGACTADQQCASGRCHPLLRECVPLGRKGVCDNCATDGECGLAADLCLTIQDGPRLLERVCGQACTSATHCPRGYACRVDGQCYPRPGSVRTHTCHSYRDTLANEMCDSAGADTCGVEGYADGTCLPIVGVCTVGCTTDADCPGAKVCMNLVVSSFCF